MSVKPDPDRALEQMLRRLEERLLQPEARQSVQELADALTDDFIEIGSSGTYLNKQQIIEELPGLPSEKMSLTDFRIRLLAGDVVLATYRLLKYDENSVPHEHSLRSSIWRLQDGRWQMIFHQGTPIVTSGGWADE